jgi:hypothetical protein
MLLGGLVFASLSQALSVSAGGIIENTYDDEFKGAMIYMPPGSDWRLLKAQCYQESRLKPLAVSPAGAYGLCQFMPNTAKYLRSKNAHLKNFWLPATSIEASARYMAQNLGFWSAKRSDVDRYMLALCNYNAGAGNCLKAQKLCNGASTYQGIIKCLPQVTGRHSEETIDYVQKIYGVWYASLLFN